MMVIWLIFSPLEMAYITLINKKREIMGSLWYLTCVVLPLEDTLGTGETSGETSLDNVKFAFVEWSFESCGPIS